MFLLLTVCCLSPFVYHQEKSGIYINFGWFFKFFLMESLSYMSYNWQEIYTGGDVLH